MTMARTTTRANASELSKFGDLQRLTDETQTMSLAPRHAVLPFLNSSTLRGVHCRSIAGRAAQFSYPAQDVNSGDSGDCAIQPPATRRKSTYPCSLKMRGEEHQCVTPYLRSL